MRPGGDYYGWVFANLAMVAAIGGVVYDIATRQASPSAAWIIVCLIFGLLALRGLKPEERSADD